MNEPDTELLRRFGREDSHEAFAELVSRHLDLVYSAARRQVRSPQLAEEVAQSVFVDLVREVRRSRPVVPLAAWLYVVTRRRAIDAIRRESRLRARERTAAEIHAMNSNPPSPWLQIEPLLDEAMARLSGPDRSTLVLRYFENRSFREVGATLGVSEDAAQKRAGRAIEQLRAMFSKRGIAVGTAALASDLTTQAVQVAPAGLGAAISTGAAAAGVGTLIPILVMTTTQKILVASALIAAIGIGLHEATLVSRKQSEIDGLKATLADLRTREQQLRGDRNELVRRLAQVSLPTPVAETAPAEAPAVTQPAKAPFGPGAILKDSTTLADSFVETLALSDAEKEVFFSVLNSTRDKLGQLSAAHATIADGPGDSVVIAVPPFAEGQAVYDEFVEKVSELLGGDRMAIFNGEYRGDALGWVFGSFGAGTRTLSINRVVPNFSGVVPGGIKLSPNSNGGFVVVEKAWLPNASGPSNLDTISVVADPSAAASPSLRAILGRFNERLNSMPALGP